MIYSENEKQLKEIVKDYYETLLEFSIMVDSDMGSCEKSSNVLKQGYSRNRWDAVKHRVKCLGFTKRDFDEELKLLKIQDEFS